MEKVIEILKKNWIIALVIILAIFFYFKWKKSKDAELKAVAEFDKLNKVSSTQKTGTAYDDERKSLTKLFNNSNEIERKLLYDLIAGTEMVFNKSYKGLKKDDAVKTFQTDLNKVQADLTSKYGIGVVKDFKAKMDKYGFDI
jgi:hypothetical protein